MLSLLILPLLVYYTSPLQLPTAPATACAAAAAAMPTCTLRLLMTPSWGCGHGDGRGTRRSSCRRWPVVALSPLEGCSPSLLFCSADYVLEYKFAAWEEGREPLEKDALCRLYGLVVHLQHIV